MLGSKVLFFLVALVVIFSALAAELEVETVYRPEDCDREANVGDHMWMHYTGTIDASSAFGVPGEEFDSSIHRGTPFDFPLGKGAVIRGWDEGLVGMCVGEKRTLVIPPHMGYGERGAGKAIPGGATLKFEVECLNIADSANGDGGAQGTQEIPNVFAEIDKNQDNQITQEEMQAWFSEQGAEIPEGLWETEDKDGDGVVTFEEFGGPKGVPMDEEDQALPEEDQEFDENEAIEDLPEDYPDEPQD